MIWVSHDFYENFTKSIDTGDIDMSLDIFRSELSDLLTYKPKELFSLFDKLKIKYNKKASYQELVDIVLAEIKKSEKFIRGLSFLIAENNQVVKKNKDVSWQKLLNKITNGINQIGKYFLDNPNKEKLFKRKVKDMIGLKSSILGDDKREIDKKDNTLAWIFGILAVGVVGYFIYTYFDKKRQDKMRAESLLPKMNLGGNINSTPTATPEPVQPVQNQPVQTAQPIAPQKIDPAYTVPEDVLLPEAKTGSVQINVSTNPTTPTVTNPSTATV